MQHALISIHDVTPETLGDVTELVAALEARGLAPLTLLVVPGRDWTPPAIERLRRWQQAGHQLAGHGWWHRAAPPRRLGHLLHATFISRACGEHLSLAAPDILTLMRHTHRWFADWDLQRPELYVPPAWALGRIESAALENQPFTQVETLRGVHDLTAGAFRPLPLLGFEADTPARAAALRLWNQSAGRRGAHTRVAIHPADTRLRLRGDLARTLDRIDSASTYAQWRLTHAA
jgi:predicted deacetylase